MNTNVQLLLLLVLTMQLRVFSPLNKLAALPIHARTHTHGHTHTHTNTQSRLHLSLRLSLNLLALNWQYKSMSIESSFLKLCECIGRNTTAPSSMVAVALCIVYVSVQIIKSMTIFIVFNFDYLLLIYYSYNLCKQ